MLDQDTKRRIDNACDILVGKVPTPLAQVEQITLALIYKFMNDMDKRALAMGGQASYFTGDYEKYSWDNLMDSRIGAQERANLYEEGLARLGTNGELPDLFRGIFKEAGIPYRAARTLNLFLKEIDGFSYEDSENLGDAYEYLLGKTGSQGEAGQFRTPRHIIDFIVQVVDPGKYDSILDPACGTAGFLISALKHIYKANTKELDGDQLSPSEQLGLSNSVYGYDITPDMVRISRVNMFLHNIKLPHIYEYDTLSSLDRWDDNFSCILANPPFMTPKGGVTPHNRFSIPSTRSEVLFVDYIMEHLTLDGKAGVIVPEGIIFQSGSAYKALRKKLISENYLWGVVSLPGGVFNPYSGVKTSILLIDRQIAKRSDKIIFFKAENDGYNLGAQRRQIEANDLPHAANHAREYKNAVMMHTEYECPDKGVILVEKAKLAESGDYNLNAERYLTANRTISEYPVVCLSEVAEVISGQSPEGMYYNSEGIGLPFYQGKTEFTDMSLGKPTKWTTKVTKKAIPNDIVMSVRAPVGPINLVVNEICIGRGLAAIRCSDRINHLYCFYVLRNMEEKINGNAGSTFASINRNDICNLKIPLPPLSIQEEIVAELDSYQKIIDGAKQVVDNWKPRIDIDPKWELVCLEKACHIQSGGTPRRDIKEYWHGDIPWVGSAVCKDVYVTEATEFITIEGLKNSSAKIFPACTTLIALVGATIGKTGYLTFACTTNQNIAGLTPKDDKHLNHSFLFFASQLLYPDFMKLGDGKFRMANLSFVRKLQIPLPDMLTQQAIVKKIENEQKLVDGNQLLIALYKQKIKDRISRLWQCNNG
jgi:type I restriction enzyme M protein